MPKIDTITIDVAIDTRGAVKSLKRLRRAFRKVGRVISTGDWVPALECRSCGYAFEERSWCRAKPEVCSSCGVRRPLAKTCADMWRPLSIRTIRVKTGFWFWQKEDRTQKKRA